MIPKPLAGSTYTVRVEREIASTPVQTLAAWTTPALLRQWWGPAGFSCPIARLDLKPGGVSLIAMRAPEAWGMRDIYNTWTYEHVGSDRLDFISRFSTPQGRAITPEAAGIPVPGVPNEVPHTVTVEPAGEFGTLLRVEERKYLSPEARDTSADGLQQCLDKLAELLGRGDHR